MYIYHIVCICICLFIFSVTLMASKTRQTTAPHNQRRGAPFSSTAPARTGSVRPTPNPPSRVSSPTPIPAKKSTTNNTTRKDVSTPQQPAKKPASAPARRRSMDVPPLTTAVRKSATPAQRPGTCRDGNPGRTVKACKEPEKPIAKPAIPPRKQPADRKRRAAVNKVEICSLVQEPKPILSDQESSITDDELIEPGNKQHDGIISPDVKTGALVAEPETTLSDNEFSITDTDQELFSKDDKTVAPELHRVPESAGIAEISSSAASDSGDATDERRIVGEQMSRGKQADDRKAERAGTMIKKDAENWKVDSSGVSNDMISETASKLREQRVNRVRALAGAFESVISLQLA